MTTSIATITSNFSWSAKEQKIQHSGKIFQNLFIFCWEIFLRVVENKQPGPNVACRLAFRLSGRTFFTTACYHFKISHWDTPISYLQSYCQAQAKAQAQLAWLALIPSSTPTHHPTQNEDNLKNDDDLKMKMTSKMKTPIIWRWPKFEDNLNMNTA